MIRSNSDTTTTTSSPTPVSPFSSNYSVPSEPTSDEAPDLGQFTAVLRAWNHLQPFPRTLHPSLVNRQEYTTSSSRTGSFPTISSEIESDEQRQPPSTVWAQRPIASYLASGDFTTDAETDRERENRPLLTSSSISTRGFRRVPTQRARRSDDEPDANVEDDDYSYARVEQSRMVQIEDLDELDSSTFGHDLYDDNETNNNKELQLVEPGSLDLSQLQLNEESEQSTGLGDMSLQEDDEQPSLGYLDEALHFISTERERWKAQREAGLTNGSTSLVPESRRKRRRKRKTLRAHSTTRASTTSTNLSLTSSSSFLASASTPSLLSTIFQSPTVRDEGEDADADDSSSSYDHRYSSSSPQVIFRQPLFKSTPATPQRRRGKYSRRQENPKLKHASSTPQLRPPSQPLVVEEDNPRVGQLRSLGKKLGNLFPEDKQFLRTVDYGTLSSTAPTSGTSYFDTFSGDVVGVVGVLGNFVDTRGASPRAMKTDGEEEERIIHVFVDHSNILIGLLNFLKRYPHQHPQYHELLQCGNNAIENLSSPVYPKPPKHLSHSALTLVLERGRPVTRRVLVTSSPLYQPMDSAELLGFDVRVFARVPDMGDGMDRERERQRPGNGHRRSFSSGSFTNNSYSNRETSGGQDISGSPKKGRKRSGSVNNGTDGNSGPPSSSNRRRGHQRGFSNGGTSTEGEQGVSLAFVRSLGGAPVSSSGNGTPSMMHLLSSSVPTSNVSTPPVSTPGQGIARVRYREQGVDELLQLKLHQALASIDGSPPKGSTIILATGDGNAGQFNEDGFLGSVRTALKRGWKVELYAWEGGLSKAWKREFGESSEWGRRGGAHGDGPRFTVIGMEQFGSELVEIYF